MSSRHEWQRHKYTFRCKDGRCKVFLNGSAEGFIAPDTKEEYDKIYVVKEGNAVHYVGATGQAMATRIRDGFNAAGEQGYHGYKWKHLEEGELFVWSRLRETSLKTNKEKYWKEREELEAIEAEFAYLVRKETNDWPVSQNEIHFHPSSAEQRAFAEKMMKEVFNEGAI